MIPVSDAELASFMEESLRPDEMARIEAALRESAPLRARLDAVRQARNRGWHSVGAIWRAHRLSCPPRAELGSFLLDALDPDRQDYVRFHTEVVGCRICLANLEDLRGRQAEQAEVTRKRRSRLFQSSVAHVPRPRGARP
jgi:hypothetical protein